MRYSCAGVPAACYSSKLQVHITSYDVCAAALCKIEQSRVKSYDRASADGIQLNHMYHAAVTTAVVSAAAFDFGRSQQSLL